MKYKLINGRPGVYEGLKKELLNGITPVVRYVGVVFGKDMMGECDDDVDMEHFIRDRIMSRVVEVEIEVVAEEKTEGQVVEEVFEPVIEEAESDVLNVEGNTVEHIEEVVEYEKQVEEKTEEPVKEKKIIRRKRGRKPKALLNEK